MEFVCLKEELAKAVQTVERIISTRSTLPIVGNILFEAKANTLKLSSNNLEIGMVVTIGSKVNTEGSILVPAKTLAGIVSKLPDGDVKFTIKDKGLIRISYGKSKFDIHGLPADEFPQLPKVKEDKSLSISSSVFINMLSQTLFASSSSDDKYVLNGALLEASQDNSEESNVRLVATDGYRLAKSGSKVPGVKGNFNVIVPNKALNEILRVISTLPEGEVNISSGHDQISFKFSEYFLVSRLIQGQFPDYRRVIPKNLSTKLLVNRKTMLAASERCAVIASQSANIVKIELKGESLIVFAQAPDVGSIEEILEVESKGKSNIQVAFNVRLLIDSLKVIGSEKVALELGGPLDPGIIKPVNDEDYIYIVMPIRTQEAAVA